jgi:hypothetical protein
LSGNWSKTWSTAGSTTLGGEHFAIFNARSRLKHSSNALLPFVKVVGNASNDNFCLWRFLVSVQISGVFAHQTNIDRLIHALWHIGAPPPTLRAQLPLGPERRDPKTTTFQVGRVSPCVVVLADAKPRTRPSSLRVVAESCPRTSYATRPR